MAVSSEKLLISSILRDHDMQVAIKAGISAEMFRGYGEEWLWLEDYYRKHRKCPTKVAFRDAFPEFAIKAVNDTGYFTDEVRKAHARHELTKAMRDAASYISDGDLTTAIKIGNSAFVQVAANLGVHNDGDILTSYEDIMEDIQRRHTRHAEYGSAGIPTGFETLDDRTGGPQAGELWVLGARQGEGKSWTLQRMAAAAIMQGYTVQFDSMEMSRSQVSMRIYSLLSGQMGKQVFNSMALMQGKDYDPVAFRKFVRGLKESIKGRLHVDDASRGKVSPLTVAAQIERNKPDIVFLDYLTLMQKNSAEWQGVAELTSELLQVGNEYGLPIWAAAQLNRESGVTRGKGKWQPPGSEALAQADSIGQDASAVITMTAPTPCTRVFWSAKMRNAESSFKFYAHLEPARGIFKEVTYDRARLIADRDDDIRDKNGE